MPKPPTWPDPPGYQDAISELKGRVPWNVSIPWQRGNLTDQATIMVQPRDLEELPYQWLNE